MEGWGSWEGWDPLDHSSQAGELTVGWTVVNMG